MSPEAAPGGRSRSTQLIVLAVLAAILLIAVVVVVSQSGSDDDDGGGGSEAAGDVQSQIEGLPQDGDTIGEPDAPVTILEFADLQCPFCAQVATDEIPTLLEGAVSRGEARIQFRNWVILGPDSELAAAAALAAGEQNRLWNFVEAFYAQQDTENSGYVTDEFLRGIAEDAGVPDLDQWETDRDPSRWGEQLRQVDRQASDLGFSGTPSFAIEGSQGIEALPNAQTAADLEQAISDASN